ncbi:MAG: glycosyltransferase family 87 protein [Terracidiphilus sp.]
MGNLRRQGLIWVLVSIGISVIWGIAIGRRIDAWIDFRAVYAGTRCLIHEHNPYNVGDLEREYRSEDGQRPKDSPSTFQAITLFVNVPTTFVFVAPFALLSWGPAHILWVLLTGCAFILAILLMWSAGANHAPKVSTLLACILAVNCESIFSEGNTAGIVVGLCGIAVWCFLENRFVWAGILCLALSLAVKPHDSGFVWLYFLLAGGIHRKRALRSVVITAVIGLMACLWLSHVAPGWMHDWHANLATISARGGINEPGPDSVSGRSLFMVVDLQAAISIFRDDPAFYNAVSYAICGAFLLAWAAWTLRTRVTVEKAWLAMGAAAAFTLLITYHRPWDAKLVMLAIPACCLLWTRRGRVGKIGFLITAAAVLFAGDVPLSAVTILASSLKLSTAGLGGQLLALVLIRPESIALLAMGIFYLWVYLRRVHGLSTGASVIQEIHGVSE